MVIEMRVPGLPLRDCTRGCNNHKQMCTQLSTIDVTEKTFFERLISSMIGHIWALSQLSLCTHNPTHSVYNYFSISEQFFSPDGPSIFLVHDSPSNLAKSQYPHRNPEWWGDFSQLVKIEKIKSLGISQYKVKLRF